MTEPMELSYKMTPETQFNAAFGWMVRRPEGGVGYFQPWHFVILAVGVASVVLAQLGFGGQSVLAGAVLGFAIMLLIDLWAGLSSNARIRRLYANSYVGHADVTVTLDADGVRFRDDRTDAHYDWRAVDDVIALKSASGLRMGASTLPIPNDALPTGTTPKEFRQALRDKIAEKRH